MRLALIIFQIGLVSTLAVYGVLASAEDHPACALPQPAAASQCDS